MIALPESCRAFAELTVIGDYYEPMTVGLQYWASDILLQYGAQ